MDIYKFKISIDADITYRTLLHFISATDLSDKPKNFNNSNSLHVETQIDNIINVKAFGAKCDGITDDSENFQKVLNYAAASNTKLEIKVSGIMYVSRSFSIPSNFVFTGTNSAKIKANFSGKSLFNVIGKSNIAFSNIKFEANTQTIFFNPKSIKY